MTADANEVHNETLVLAQLHGRTTRFTRSDEQSHSVPTVQITMSVEEWEAAGRPTTIHASWFPE